MNVFEKATPVKYGFFKKMHVWFFSNPIFIYTMGKVGSSTIANSLRAYGISEVQPHSLRFSAIGGYFVRPPSNTVRKIRNFLKTVLIRLKTRLLLLKIKLSGRPVKIITLMREPVSRNISAFFEQFDHLNLGSVESYSVNELTDFFWSYCRHDTPEIWFDDELKAVFGVNIFEYEYEKNHGCCVIKKGLCEILVVKMEFLSGLKNDLGRFFDVPSFEIVSTNRSEKKEYYRIYNEFRNNLVVPMEYLDRMYSSKAVSHFYTEDEIRSFYLLWSKN